MQLSRHLRSISHLLLFQLLAIEDSSNVVDRKSKNETTPSVSLNHTNQKSENNVVKLNRSPPRERLHWVDYTKGIGIFLVVVGHVLRGLLNSSILKPSPWLSFVDQWIYAFHMPLFFFISGLFVQRSLSKPLKVFLLDKLYVIAYPYFVWSILQSIIQIYASKYSNHPITVADIWKIGYQPILQFWFLYTLFVIVVAYGILSKLKLSPNLFLIFSILLYCAYVFNVDFGPWGVLYLVRRHAIYFALGVIVGSGKLLSILNRIKLFALVFITLTGYLAVGLAVQLQLAENVIAIPVLAMLGITASMTLAMALEKSNALSFVKNWGICSLEIFLAHTIAVSVFRIALQKFFGFTEPLTHFLLETAIGIYAPIALIIIICSKLKFPYIFTLRSLK